MVDVLGKYMPRDSTAWPDSRHIKSRPFFSRLGRNAILKEKLNKAMKESGDLVIRSCVLLTVSIP